MKSEWILQGTVLLLGVFLITFVLERRLVPLLKKCAAQPILEIGPVWHLGKKGTPTLGGLGFILAIFTVLLFYIPFCISKGDLVWKKLLLLLLFALSCGAIGVLDDWRKLTKKQNKGLSAAQKYFLQLVVSGVFLFVSERYVGISTSIALPFTNITLEMGYFYYPFAILFLTGIVNALNLTDGVDGLLSSLVGVLSAFLLLSGIALGEEISFLLGSLLLGGMLGFLCFNAHPAKIFMGDTGSLFLGGAVAGYAVLSPNPVAVLLACGVFVIEAFSVILQVVFFKLTGGKRLFRMAPLHHHFEKGGWSEERIVALFCAGGVMFALLAFLVG